MKASTKLVTFSIVTILLISIVVSIIGWNFQDYDSRFSEQECSREGKYCIFNDIPTGMMYSTTEESPKSSEEFTGEVEDYVYNIYADQDNYPKEYPEGRVATPRTTEFYIYNIDDYRCISTDQTPQVIEYFTEFCGLRMEYGCGEERRAIVCDERYLIQETVEYQTKFYGPYNMPGTIN